MTKAVTVQEWALRSQPSKFAARLRMMHQTAQATDAESLTRLQSDMLTWPGFDAQLLWIFYINVLRRDQIELVKRLHRTAVRVVFAALSQPVMPGDTALTHYDPCPDGNFDALFADAAVRDERKRLLNKAWAEVLASPLQT